MKYVVNVSAYASMYLMYHVHIFHQRNLYIHTVYTERIFNILWDIVSKCLHCCHGEQWIAARNHVLTFLWKKNTTESHLLNLLICSHIKSSISWHTVLLSKQMCTKKRNCVLIYINTHLFCCHWCPSADACAQPWCAAESAPSPRAPFAEGQGSLWSLC